MKQNGHSKFSNNLRRVAIAIVASANASNVVLVPPTAQPKSARQTGEAIKRPAVVTYKDRWERDYELGRAGAG
jgi:hypothetical protein